MSQFNYIISFFQFGTWRLDVKKAVSRNEMLNQVNESPKFFLSAISNARKDFAFSAHQLVDVQYITFIVSTITN
jgi:hypothetical protein